MRTDRGIMTGTGAWELAFRVSHLELLSNAPQGGTLTDLTAGVNWYWNPYSKLVLNYIHAYADERIGGKSDTNILGLRAQIDF